MISEKRIVTICHHQRWPNHMIRRFDLEDSTKEILYWRKYSLYYKKIRVNGCQTMRALTW